MGFDKNTRRILTNLERQQEEFNMSNNSSQNRVQRLVRLGLLLAVLLIMAYTPLGYLRTPGLEISFLTVPVIIGAIILGPVEGAILGAAFGITSFLQCFGGSAFGQTLLAISPVLTFIVCVPTRALMGGLCGLLFRGLQKLPLPKLLPFGLASLSGALLNTLFFMGALVLCFYNTEFIQGLAGSMGATNPLNFVLLFVGIQGLIEAVVCCLLGGSISRALWRFNMNAKEH